MFETNPFLFWDGLIIGVLSIIPVILLTWRIITPAMRKAVIDWLDRRWTWLKEDTAKDCGREVPHRRTY